MDVDSSQARMAAYMRDHQDKVVGRWTELVVAGLRGRSSAAEVRRELDDLYSLVVRAMSGADEQAAGELRAVLAELSRSRARNGFTPTETALGVFALKDAVYELVADTAELVPEYLAFSRMTRRPRPAHLRDLRGGPGADHRRSGRAPCSSCPPR